MAALNNQSSQLPREDQWEYAAKYGLPQECWHWRYWWGDDFDAERDRDRINCRETSKGHTLFADKTRSSAEVRQWDSQQGLGLIDMLGNVWQWCADAFPDVRANYDPQRPMLRENASVFRSVRGGSFSSSAVNARCSNRGSFAPSNANQANGVRVTRAGI